MRPLIIPIFIPHAGCPFDCSYCNQRLIAGQSGGLPEAGQIHETVRQWTTRSPGRSAEVAFYGGSFTMLPVEQQRRLLEAVQPLIQQQLVSSVRLSTRPDGLSDEILSFLAGYGVRTIEIGVQSLDDEVLELAGRGHSAADSLDALQRIMRAGFRTGAQLLPGLPGDTPEKALDSLQGVVRAGAQFVRIYPALALAGTGLAARYHAGQWQPWPLDVTIQLCARMLLFADQAGVPVIRLGLQSDDGLVEGETVLAGPWHPALGQLVRNELYFCLVCAMASRLSGPIQRIACHPDRLSDVGGHGQRNLRRWRQQGIAIKTITADAALPDNAVRAETCNHQMTCSIVTDLNDKEIVDAQRISQLS